MAATPDASAAVADLNALANRHGSDKGDAVGLRHGYVRVYGALLARLRPQPFKLLEIGLSVARDGRTCPSLAMWADWAPAADILGVDIADYSAFQRERCRTMVVDQTDAAALISLAEAEGPFDVIVDDGAHASDAQQVSFFALFPFLRNGGFYFIEDLHFQPREEPEAAIKTRQIFRAWAGGLRPEACARIAGRHGLSRAHVAACMAEISGLQFFDSLAPDRPAPAMADALLAIEKIA